MNDTNGVIDFTHDLKPFRLEGHTFRRRKVDTRDWFETQREAADMEQQQIDGKTGLTLAFSADGLYNLIRLAIHEDDLPAWDELRESKRVEWGELLALREWLWEQVSERPFQSDMLSSDGPGSNEASSEVSDPSPVAIQTG